MYGRVGAGAVWSWEGTLASPRSCYAHISGIRPTSSHDPLVLCPFQRHPRPGRRKRPHSAQLHSRPYAANERDMVWHEIAQKTYT